MIVSCQHCGKKLKVDFSMIQGDRVKVRCKHCRQLFKVTRPAGEEGLEAEEGSGDEAIRDSGVGEPDEGMGMEGWSLKFKLTAIIVLLMVGALSATWLIVFYLGRATLAKQTDVLALWAVVLLITVWISLYVGRWITRPINNLIRLANQISQGKTNLEELPEQRKDEIGLLTRPFNRLVASLRVALSRRR